MKKAVELKKENYTIQVNYSDEAIEKKLMKFISKSGDEFEISAEEMMTILVGQVNSETLEAAFVETDKVHVVEVSRQVAAKANRDIKKGETIRLEYNHPYPLEFAILEEVMKIAKINMDVPMMTLTKEYIDEYRPKANTPERKKFINRFYEFFKTLKSQKK